MNDESFLNLDQLSEFLSASPTTPSSSSSATASATQDVKQQVVPQEEVIELDLTKLKQHQQQPTVNERSTACLPFAHCIQSPIVSSGPSGGFPGLLMDLLGLPNLVSHHATTAAIPAGVICSIEINGNRSNNHPSQNHPLHNYQPEPYYGYNQDLSDSSGDDCSEPEEDEYYRDVLFAPSSFGVLRHSQRAARHTPYPPQVMFLNNLYHH